MLNEFNNSVSSVFKERIVSPLFGSFILSWCAWNWRFLYYLTAIDDKVDVHTRFDYINEHYINYNSLSSITNLIAGPLITTVVWILLYPVANSTIETYLAHKRAKKMRQIQAIDKTIPLSHEEAMAIYEKAEKQQERYDKLSRDNHERIAKLNKENEYLKNRKTSLEETEQVLRGNLEAVQKQTHLQAEEIVQLKTKIEKQLASLRKAEFGKWADNFPLITAYTALKQNPVLDKAFTQIIKLPEVSFRKELEVNQKETILNQLTEKGLVNSFRLNENNKYVVTLSSIGWQLIDLYHFRSYVERYELRTKKRSSVKSL